MPTYATTAHVAPRLGARPFNTTSKPSTTEVTEWLDEAEAELLGTLESVGIPSVYSDGTRGFRILRGWVANYIAGRVRQSHGAAGGDGGNDDGDKFVDEWHALLKRIREEPETIGAMLNGGETPAETVSLGSHVTDSALGLSESDYAPVFRIKGENF